MSNKLTEISELGEFGLIKRLTEDIALNNPSTIKGVGDDCAVMHYHSDKEILIVSVAIWYPPILN